MTNPITALTEPAARESDGSPAAEPCRYLVREVHRRDHEAAARDLAELRQNAADGGDGAHLVLGAAPAPLTRPAPGEPSATVRRAGRLSITDRRDTPAHRVAAFAQRWDGGQDRAHRRRDRKRAPPPAPPARQWAQRLVSADPDQPPTVLEKALPATACDTDPDVLLHDPVTDLLSRW